MSQNPSLTRIPCVLGQAPSENVMCRDIYGYPMRTIELNKGTLLLTERQVLGFLERKVTPFGNSAKVDCPKRFVGKRVYVIVCSK